MARWAIHNIRSIELCEDAWVMETPRGTGRFVPHFDAAHGVLDHEFIDPREGRWSVPARIVPIGPSASLYQITLTKPEGMPEEMFWQRILLLDEELQALKSCVETIR